jgi:hypothetical protein
MEVRQFNSLDVVLSQANSCTQTRLDMFQFAIIRATDLMSGSSPSSREGSKCQWSTVGGKMSDKDLEQWINKVLCDLSFTVIIFVFHTLYKASFSPGSVQPIMPYYLLVAQATTTF